MFGLFKRDPIQSAMNESAKTTLESWQFYVGLYEVLDVIGQAKVKEHLKKTFNVLMMKHPNLFEMEPVEFLKLTEDYSAKFNKYLEEKQYDEFMSAGAQMLMTFFYAKCFCNQADVSTISKKIKEMLD